MRARYYDPQLKRFLNRDVLRGDLLDGQTFNRYAYVNGDPIRYIDPLGLCKEGSAKGKGKEVDVPENPSVIDFYVAPSGVTIKAKEYDFYSNVSNFFGFSKN